MAQCISSVESQKGVIASQRCSIENQKGTIARCTKSMAIAPFCMVLNGISLSCNNALLAFQMTIYR